ncbi:MAG: protein translocase subunit SecF [bacterium]
MFIVKNRKIFYTLSLVLVIASIVAVSVWGLVLGIDFKGGSIMEFTYANGRPDISEVKANLDRVNTDQSIQGYLLRSYGTDGYSLKTPAMSSSTSLAVQSVLSIGDKKAELKKLNSIGPVVGAEAAKKSIISIILVLLAIILFISFAFRKVSEPVSSWKYGLFAIVALLHDVFIPVGAFAVLGHFLGYEVDTLFVTAMLVVLGFSVHDTIVVYDRVRENLKLNRLNKVSKHFVEIVGDSIKQTIVRSINTSLAVLLSVVALYFFGPESTKNFSLVLIIGIFFGTYSSIFIASNLLVTADKISTKKSKLK